MKHGAEAKMMSSPATNPRLLLGQTKGTTYSTQPHKKLVKETGKHVFNWDFGRSAVIKN